MANPCLLSNHTHTRHMRLLIYVNGVSRGRGGSTGNVEVGVSWIGQYRRMESNQSLITRNREAVCSIHITVLQAHLVINVSEIDFVMPVPGMVMLVVQCKFCLLLVYTIHSKALSVHCLWLYLPRQALKLTSSLIFAPLIPVSSMYESGCSV